MKAKFILCAASLAVLVTSGCGRQKTQMEVIGNEEAKRLALADAGLSAAEVEFTASDLASRRGVEYYQVDFTADGQSYKYDIDAITGTVIDSEVPKGSAVTTGNTEQSSKKKAADQNKSAENGSDASAAEQNSGGEAGMLTQEEAKQKALEHAGLSAKSVNFIKCELDYEHRQQVYDVEFYSADGKEYDYEISASTGEVISYDYDAEGYTPPASDNGKMLSAQNAKELALSQVPGASVNDIYEFEIDTDDGRTEYEGKIIYNGMEYEFEIDAYSGAMRSWESEPLD